MCAGAVPDFDFGWAIRWAKKDNVLQFVEFEKSDRTNYEFEQKRLNLIAEAQRIA